MYATLPLAIQHDSETLWPSSAESASIKITQRAGSPSLWPESHHKRQEDSHFDYSSACLQWAVQTYTASLQRYTVAGCLILLPAARSSVPTATLWELLLATTLIAFSGTTYNCSIGPAMPSRCRCLSPPLKVIYTVATSYALRHCRQSGADWIVQES